MRKCAGMDMEWINRLVTHAGDWIGLTVLGRHIPRGAFDAVAVLKISFVAVEHLIPWW